MTLHWTELRASHFFTWFGLRETDRVPSAAGATISCAPGNFADHIALTFEVDAAETVQRAVLTLDRAWLEGLRTAPFAADIAKSFILTLAAGDAAMAALGRQIELRMGRLPGVIARPHAEEPPPAALAEVIAAALAVYEGGRERAELRGPGQTLVISNDAARRRPYLQIAWAALPGASRARGKLWRRLLAARTTRRG